MINMPAKQSEIVKKAKICLKNGENQLSAQIALGIAAFESGSVSEAIKFYGKALKIDSDSPEANAGIGISFARQGDLKKAIEHLQQAVDKNPGCGMLANWLADAYFDSGELDRAIEYYSSAIRLNAMDSNAHNDMADVYRLKGDFVRALELYEKTLQIDPLDTNAILEKAQCLVQLKKDTEALITLDSLIHGYPSSRDCATAIVIKGTLNLKAGKSKVALDNFKQALEYFPFNRSVLFQAAVSAIKSEKKDEAAVFLQKILDMTPDDKRALVLMKKVRN